MAFWGRELDFDNPTSLAPKTFDLPDLPWGTLASRVERITILDGAFAKLQAFCAVVEEAVAVGNKDLDRPVPARYLMNRVMRTCCSNSKLPALVDLFLSLPLVTVPLGAKLLQVMPKAVDPMLAQLSGARPREPTGRSRSWASRRHT